MPVCICWRRCTVRKHPTLNPHSVFFAHEFFISSISHSSESHSITQHNVCVRQKYRTINTCKVTLPFPPPTGVEVSTAQLTDSTAQEPKAIHILHFRPCPEGGTPLGGHRHVGIHSQRAILHVPITGANGLKQQLQFSHKRSCFHPAPHVWLSHNLHQTTPCWHGNHMYTSLANKTLYTYTHTHTVCGRYRLLTILQN